MPLTMLIRLFLRTGAGSPFNPVAPRRAFTSFLHWAETNVCSWNVDSLRGSHPTGIARVWRLGISREPDLHRAGIWGPATKIAPGFYLVRAPVWSPDGNALLFWGQRDRDAPPENNVDWYVSDLKGAPPIRTEARGALAGEHQAFHGLPYADAWSGNRIVFHGHVGDLVEHVAGWDCSADEARFGGATRHIRNHGRSECLHDVEWTNGVHEPDEWRGHGRSRLTPIASGRRTP